LKTITRVEKFQKYREEISHMPNINDISNGKHAESYLVANNTKPKDRENDAGGSTIEHGIEEIIDGVRQSEENDNGSQSPIQKQKRKELIQMIVLISVLVILIIGLIIIGIYAFR